MGERPGGFDRRGLCMEWPDRRRHTHGHPGEGGSDSCRLPSKGDREGGKLGRLAHGVGLGSAAQSAMRGVKGEGLKGTSKPTSTCMRSRRQVCSQMSGRQW